MKLKYFVQGLNLIDLFNKMAKTLLSHKHVSNTPIEIYIIHLICFSHFYSLLSLLLIFIKHKSHWSSEIDPERNWHYIETSSATNDDSGPPQRSYYQPDSYNKHQNYLQDITTQKFPSINLHDREIVYNQSIIHCNIPPPPT